MMQHDGNNVVSNPLAEALARVRARIRAAELAYGRSPGSVSLLAVSKRQPAEQLAAAWAVGQRAFGESYVQEALDKQRALAAMLPPEEIEWHFIGRMQANKTARIAEQFAWVHGLCDLDHARRLSAQRPAGWPPLRLCVQVNLSGEASKAGLAPQDLAPLLTAVRDLPGLRIEGLMTLPAPSADLAAQRRPFAALRQLRDRLADDALPLATLSMGMSGDLEAAIAEGATIVRVGTAIFGERPPG